MTTFTQETDGVTHVNVYSKGKTELGRFLSNFSYSPFEHPEDGRFCSVEGYWYWLSSKDDRLRTLYGFRAKQYGREIGAKDWLDTEEFKAKIRLAIATKLQTHPRYLALLRANSLPLTHYYCYGNRIIHVPEAGWIIEFLEKFSRGDS